VASSLRSYRREDAPGVLELSRHALKRADKHVGNPLWATLDELESELGDWDIPPEETLLVDEEAGEVVGFGGVEVSTGWADADLFGPLVDTRFRGQKLGTLLLQGALERAKTRGAKRVIAALGTRNRSGAMLLESAGFRPAERADAVFRLALSDHHPVGDAPAGVNFRTGIPDDLPNAYPLYKECFPDGNFPEEAWRQGLQGGTVYLAESESGPVAVVNIDRSDRWIYHVGVTESERSRGVGGYLLSSALSDYWEQHPGETLGLSVRADNVPAIRLYRRQGFAPWLVLQRFELTL
jgi:ribosomal protein S18 acetylase RimI-like enzyme